VACAAACHLEFVNVDLRPLVVGDAAWLAPWLPAVAASVGHDARDVASLLARAKTDRSLRLCAIERDEEAVGVLIARDRAPRRGSALIELVALSPDRARRGSGMRAAALIEAELVGAGARRIYAPAPAVHGIDVYFWIRLGYHPLLRTDWPCEREGVAWMVRELSA